MTNDFEKILRQLEKSNPFGEKVTLVAATKTRSAEEINCAIAAGVQDVGENKVQEFCAKFDLVHGARRHFIGRLQRNKVKYLIGKTFLIQSVDRDSLAEEIARLSSESGTVTDILIQINVGNEPSKGGYPLAEGMAALDRLSSVRGLRVKGFMAMLPQTDDEKILVPLCKEMRALFERARGIYPETEYLSMGMSGDWELCIEHGSNMVRLGTALFGKRPLTAETARKEQI